jgi:hypothetical protein
MPSQVLPACGGYSCRHPGPDGPLNTMRSMPRLIRSAQELLRQVYGIEPTPGEHIQTSLNRELFLGNDIGAWVTVQPDGITLGSIVEGSEAEIGPYRLGFPFSAWQYEALLRVIEAEVGDVLEDGPRSQDGAEDLDPIIFPFEPGTLS